MAYVSCAAKIAASIQQDCNKPLVGGYTGRAVIMSATDFERAEVVRSATNPREILSVVLPPDGSVMAYTIDNVFAQPFTGSTTAGNNENGRNGYSKTLSVRVPMRGADVSKDVIEPLVKDPNGFVAIVEKRDKVGDGSYEVIGYQNALRGDIAGVTRDESANGGDWIVPLTTVETWAEVTLVGAAETYESARKEFEELLYFEPTAIRLVFVEGENGVQLTANGLVVIESIQGGEKVRDVYSALNDTSVTINADTDTEVVIYGAVTKFRSFSNYPSNTIKSLDVRKNVALTNLYCGNCSSLTSLDVSKNVALTIFECSNCTGLTSLDVSKNTALTKFICNGCTGLTSLDLSKNTALTKFVCSNCTGLTSLDVSKNVALTILECGNCTGLTSLYVSNNVSLTELKCSDCSSLMLIDLANLANVELLEGFNTAYPILDYPNLTTIQVNGSNTVVQDMVEAWFPVAAQSDGMLYVDENTNQSLITAAETKGWEVIYVS